MLIIPEGPAEYRILGIDPGTNTLGVAILDYNLEKNNLSLVHATTLQGARDSKEFPHIGERFGERQAKLHAHHGNLIQILTFYRPHCVIAESPFMGRFPQAFRALIECMLTIQDAVSAFNPNMCLETVDPSSAKNAVGAAGRGGGKEAVREALRTFKNLKGCPGEVLDRLDEHSVDAIAVACSKYQSIRAD